MSESDLFSFEKAWEVAHAVETERGMIAGAQLLDTVLEPWIGNDGPQSLAVKAELAGSVHSMYKVYPELFSHVVRRGREFDEDAALASLPEILKHGGLPIVQTDTSTFRRSIADLEALADAREEAAIALFDTPPNEAYMQDHKLKAHQLEKDGVKVVVGLLESAEFYRDRARRAEESAASRYEIYQEPDQKSPKMKQIVYMLESTCGTLNAHLDDTVFEARVEAALNNEKTSLGDLEQLWLEGERLVVTKFRRKAEQKQQTHREIVSGAAATYESPVAA